MFVIPFGPFVMLKPCVKPRIEIRLPLLATVTKSCPKNRVTIAR